MNPSDQFERFATECEVMAKVSPCPENRTVWRQSAERWRKIADLFERQTSGPAAIKTATPFRRKRPVKKSRF